MDVGLPHGVSERLHSVEAYWQAKRHEAERIPKLSEIDMMELYAVAPFMCIADLVGSIEDQENADYCWRYWGTGVRDITGVEATGKFLNQTHKDYALQEIVSNYTMVLRERAPSYWRRPVQTVGPDRSFLFYERIIFPLLDDNDRPAHILLVCSTISKDQVVTSLSVTDDSDQIDYGDIC